MELVSKTVPYKHQADGFALSAERRYFALLMEQGTGKTKLTIDTAAALALNGLIDTIIVVAPNGVHRNWLRLEMPKHLTERVPYLGAVWSSTPRVQEAKDLEAALVKPTSKIRIVTFNFESVALSRTQEYLKKLLRRSRTLAVVDESHRIGSHDAKTTKAVLQLIGPRSDYRRILTGTPISNTPLNAYSQLKFLHASILPQSTFAAFRSRYAVMLPSDHPMVKGIQAARNLKFAPPLQASDSRGRPRYQHLDELRNLIAPHSYRVLKKDCLDLPEKVYVRRAVEMSKEQEKWYDKLSSALKSGMLQLGDMASPVTKLTVVLQFQQILCGIIPRPLDVENKRYIFSDPSKNPRIQALLEELSETDESVIVWARFTSDIHFIHQALEREFGSGCSAMFYGGVSSDERLRIEDSFQSGDIRFLVGNPAAGGTGLNLTRGTQAHYYSNTFKYVDRAQSEDRNHRIGTVSRVRYVDYEVEGSVDTKILQALIFKKDVADVVVGDDFTKWIRP